MPVFNGEEFLEEAIESILIQSLPNFELLIVDDASSDASPRIVERFASQDSRIRVITKTQNLGLVAARNTIMDAALGEFIAWNDQDDVSSASRLEVQAKTFESDPSLSVLGSWTLVRSQLGAQLNQTVRRMPLRDPELRSALIFANVLSCNTVALRRQPFIDHDLLFSPGAENALDYDLWTRCSGALKMRNLPRVLGTYRVHHNQNSSGAGGTRMAERAWEIQNRYLAKSLGEFSATSISIHRLLGESVSQCATTYEPQEVSLYLTSLHDRNHGNRVFSQASFNRTLGTRWFLYSRERLRQHPSDIKSILFETPTKWLPSTTARYLSWRFHQ